MRRERIYFFALAIFSIVSCQTEKPNQPAAPAAPLFKKGTFGYDLSFLRQKDTVIVLYSNDGKGKVIVSPKYQGKVFTSTADGLDGKSFGWINYKAFSQKTPDLHMNAYGGEDRLWIGPEGGRFALFFRPRSKMDFANWHTPPAIDFEEWKLTAGSNKKASFIKPMQMVNYAGTMLTFSVNRDVEIIDVPEMKKTLGVEFDDKIKSVGFKTSNTITNTGNQRWDKKSGAPCLWNLDMFSPSEQTITVIPYEKKSKGKVATTDYFGEISKDRIKYNKGILLFKADGKSRGKLGLSPGRAKNIAGSYDAVNNVLTITLFNIEPQSIYLNQEWKTNKNPFKGDAVNAYNDGPLANGTQMGPFYEIESVSQAAFLKPGGKLTHVHSVFHFTGDKDELNQIALKTLGISLQDIQTAFK